MANINELKLAKGLRKIVLSHKFEKNIKRLDEFFFDNFLFDLLKLWLQLFNFNSCLTYLSIISIDFDVSVNSDVDIIISANLFVGSI